MPTPSSRGVTSFTSKRRAKEAYLRRHGMKQREGPSSAEALAYHVHQESMQSARLPYAPARMRISEQQEQRQQSLGVARISEQLFDKVTMYHAQIGANVEPAQLKGLQDGMVREAEKMIEYKSFDDALNLFTHALAISEKTGDAATQASIIHNIGFCLHCLGEFEAAKAYYTQALEKVQRLQPSLSDTLRSIGSLWNGGTDVNSSRILHIKERLFDVERGLLPDGCFLDEYGRKQPMPRAVADCDEEDGEVAYDETGRDAPAWLRAAPPQDDEPEYGHNHEWRGGRGAPEDDAAEGEADADADAEDDRDPAAKEAARKEWLQYYLQTGEWDQAEELVVSAEEAEDLRYLVEREHRLLLEKEGLV